MTAAKLQKLAPGTVKLLAAIGCLALWLAITGCDSRKDLPAAFHASAEACVKNGGSAISFSALTQFEWDKALIFGPYTSVKTINSQLGYEWPEAEKSGIQSSEGLYLIVFVKDQRVIRHFKFRRIFGDFCDLNSGNVFERGKDLFEVHERPKSEDTTADVGGFDYYPKRVRK